MSYVDPFDAGSDGITQSIPPCAPACPNLAFWPSKNLISGACPECGSLTADGRKAARVLRARQLTAELGR